MKGRFVKREEDSVLNAAEGEEDAKGELISRHVTPASSDESTAYHESDSPVGAGTPEPEEVREEGAEGGVQSKMRRHSIAF